MKLKKVARGLLIAVLALDVIVVLTVVGSSWTPLRAQTAAGSAATAGAAPDGENRWTLQAVQLLGQELARRVEQLERREAEVAELLRASEVLQQAGIDPADQAAQRADTPATPSPPQDNSARQAYFEKLRKTYANMEPETAAQALASLARRDKDAVVQLLLGWNPKVSGAVLDALTLNDPGLAADLSYGIWLLSGKNQPQAAGSDR